MSAAKASASSMGSTSPNADSETACSTRPMKSVEVSVPKTAKVTMEPSCEKKCVRCMA